MKNLSVLFISMIAMAVLVACGGANKTESAAGEEATAGSEAVTYAVSGSSIGWLAKKVTGQHNGDIQIADGEIMVEGGKIVAGNFSINTKSINVLDLEAGSEMHGKLVGHLNSPDFFNTDSFPTATFAITKVVALENNADANTIVSGNLTIKGISQEISFPAQVNITDNALTTKANITIDRTRWDIRYGSGKFFEGLGDKMIYDDFELMLDLTASKSGMASN